MEALRESSTCVGEISRALLDNDHDRADEAVAWYRDVFGKENFILNSGSRHSYQYRVNRVMLDLARKTDTRLITTSDVHYSRQDDLMQDVLLCIQTGKLLSDPGMRIWTTHSTCAT